MVDEVAGMHEDEVSPAVSHLIEVDEVHEEVLSQPDNDEAQRKIIDTIDTLNSRFNWFSMDEETCTKQGMDEHIKEKLRNFLVTARTIDQISGSK
ncbi:MAG: hypothetical protein ABH851_02805 [Methanobacteriota archaeon]